MFASLVKKLAKTKLVPEDMKLNAGNSPAAICYYLNAATKTCMLCYVSMIVSNDSTKRNDAINSKT